MFYTSSDINTGKKWENSQSVGKYLNIKSMFLKKRKKTEKFKALFQTRVWSRLTFLAKIFLPFLRISHFIFFPVPASCL